MHSETRSAVDPLAQTPELSRLHRVMTTSRNAKAARHVRPNFAPSSCLELPYLGQRVQCSARQAPAGSAAVLLMLLLPLPLLLCHQPGRRELASVDSGKEKQQQQRGVCAGRAALLARQAKADVGTVASVRLGGCGDDSGHSTRQGRASGGANPKGGGDRQPGLAQRTREGGRASAKERPLLPAALSYTRTRAFVAPCWSFCQRRPG